MSTEHRHDDDTQVNLSEHFTLIYRFLTLVATCFDPDTGEEYEAGHTDLWRKAAEPLRLAASIAEIKVTPDILFGDSYLFCKNALEFELRMGQLTSLYIRETTRFIWAWFAYDKLIRIVNGNSNERISVESRKIITFLRKDESLVPERLAHNLQHVAMLAAGTEIVEEFNDFTKNNTNKLFPHIHFCRIARNCFLHSRQVDLLLDSDVMEHSEKDFSNNKYIALPRALTRLILLTIQHILAVYYKDSKHMTDLYMSADEDEADLTLSDALLVLHLKEEVAHKTNLTIPLWSPNT